MIEIIYQGEEEGQTEQRTDLKLPKNVRQIGDVGQENRKIYVEDFVMSYVKHFSSRHLKYGVLLGNVIKQGGNTYFFISGAVCAKPVIDNEIIFDEDVWTGIYEDIKAFFDNVEIIGWFLSIPGMLAGDMANIQKIHLDNFAGNDKVCFVLDRVECEDSFYSYNDGGMKKIEGHYIYYEKNADMQSYMVVNEDVNEIPTEYEQSKKRSINATVHRLLYRIDRDAKKTAEEQTGAKKMGNDINQSEKSDRFEAGEMEGALKRKNRRNKNEKNSNQYSKAGTIKGENSISQVKEMPDEKKAVKAIDRDGDGNDAGTIDKVNGKNDAETIDKVNEKNNAGTIGKASGKSDAKTSARLSGKRDAGTIGRSSEISDAKSIHESNKKGSKKFGEVDENEKVKLKVSESKVKNESDKFPQVINEKIMIEKTQENKKKSMPLFAYSASSFMLIAILLGAISVMHTSGQIKDIKNMVSKMANATVTENPENINDSRDKEADKQQQNQNNIENNTAITAEIVDAAADVTTSSDEKEKSEEETTKPEDGEGADKEVDGQTNTNQSGSENEQDESKQAEQKKGEEEKQSLDNVSSNSDGNSDSKKENENKNEDSKEKSDGDSDSQEKAASVEPQYYIVKKGDSLYSISKLVYGDINMIDKIREANHMSETDENITIGQRLLLP